MWVVVLVRPTKLHVFRADYFPRRFAYKRDAEELVKEVASMGGEARIERAPPKGGGK